MNEIDDTVDRLNKTLKSFWSEEYPDITINKIPSPISISSELSVPDDFKHFLKNYSLDDLQVEGTVDKIELFSLPKIQEETRKYIETGEALIKPSYVAFARDTFGDTTYFIDAITSSGQIIALYIDISDKVITRYVASSFTNFLKILTEWVIYQNQKMDDESDIDFQEVKKVFLEKVNQIDHQANKDFFWSDGSVYDQGSQTWKPQDFSEN